MKYFRPVAILLVLIHTIFGFIFVSSGEAFGGMFGNNSITTLMKNILNIATLIVFIQGGEWLRKGGQRIREGEFYVIILATLLGMYLMISATNFLLLYIGTELASLPSACLAAWNKSREESAEAGAKLILMTALSSGIMMFGLSYIYGATGTMYFIELAQSPLTVLGFVFFFAGLAFKISLVPMHMWAPDVYEGSPTATTSYLSVVSKGAAIFALAITLHRVFGALQHIWYPLLWAFSVVTIVVGNLFALRQKEMKRFFAYSSISQAGFILLGLLHGSHAGFTAVVYYVFVYVFSNLAAFGVIAVVENNTGRTDIAAYNGFYRFNPRLALTMMLAVFSLAGIPPLGGFFSKFFIFAAAAEGGDYILVLITTLNTVVSLYYYLRIVRAMFISTPDEEVRMVKIDPWGGIGLVICVVGIVLTGIASGVYGYIYVLAW